MANVVCLTYNPFQENTYIVYDETNECVIFDPGCYDAREKRDLSNQLERLNLKPVRLINTHCHLDHVFGNNYVANTYNLLLEIHKGEQIVLDAVPQVCQMYGLPMPDPTPKQGDYLVENTNLSFGNTTLKLLLTPGHSPASLCFYSKADRFVIGGDVLFRDSIGRTDLPGGNYETLISSIVKQLFPLGDDVVVYPGHGPETTIGYEKENNPFLKL